METQLAIPELCEGAWDALGPPTASRAPHIKVGRGLACNFQPYGRIVWLHDWSSAWVGFEMDGSLVVRCGVPDVGGGRSEEHTSELQSLAYLVCRLLLEKKKKEKKYVSNA